MKPFSCGTQFGDWEAANCERCTKGAPDGGGWPICPIQEELYSAYFGDGEISDITAKRMTLGEGRYNWQCGEVEWTEEWKAKCEQV